MRSLGLRALWVLSLVILLAFVDGPDTVRAQEAGTVTVIVESGRILRGPSLTTVVVAVAVEGTALRLIGREGDWLLVEIPDALGSQHRGGYIHRGEIRIGAPVAHVEEGGAADEGEDVMTAYRFYGGQSSPDLPGLALESGFTLGAGVDYALNRYLGVRGDVELASMGAQAGRDGDLTAISGMINLRPTLPLPIVPVSLYGFGGLGYVTFHLEMEYFDLTLEDALAFDYGLGAEVRVGAIAIFGEWKTVRTFAGDEYQPLQLGASWIVN